MQEILHWRSDTEVEALRSSASGRQRLEEEIADVLIFGLLFCHDAGLDPAKVVGRKLRTNARKSPVRLADPAQLGLLSLSTRRSKPNPLVASPRPVCLRARSQV